MRTLDGWVERFKGWKRNEVQVFRNIRSETKNVGYNPEIGTNWCHLPMEIRMKCIRSMDIPTRFCLKDTSRTEKALVDAQKVCFERVEITEFKMDFWHEYPFAGPPKPDFSFKINKKCTENPKNHFLKAAQLLKMATRVDFVLTSYATNSWPELERLAPYHIKRICSLNPEGADGKLSLFLLRNSVERVEELRLLGDVSNFFQIFRADVPKFMFTKFSTLPRDLVLYVQKWMYNDVEIGTRMHFCLNSYIDCSWLPEALRRWEIFREPDNHYHYYTGNPEKELHLKIRYGNPRRWPCVDVFFEMLSTRQKKLRSERIV